MLFNEKDALKKISVISGCEKMRCMLSRTMLMKAMFDDKPLALDIESTDNSFFSLKVTIPMTSSSRDLELIKTVCYRILEIGSIGS